MKLATFIFVLTLAALEAATLTTDGSVSDVQAKINAAANGDTVCVGDCVTPSNHSWGSSLTINGKHVWLKGAGASVIKTSSQTAHSLTTGTKIFVTSPDDSRSSLRNVDFVVGESVIIERLQKRGTQYMEGTVVSWAGVSANLEINVTSATPSSAGTGPWDSWIIRTVSKTKVTMAHNGPNDSAPARGIDVTESTVGSIEFSDLEFASLPHNGDFSKFYLVGIYVAPAVAGKPIKVHDCFFGMSGMAGMDILTNRGVVWNTDSHVGDETGGGTVARNELDSPGDNSWTTASTMGAADVTGQKNFYYEDCYFAGLLVGFDVSDYSRVVFRHCVFDNSMIASHGADTGQASVRHVEIYDSGLLYTPSLHSLQINLQAYLYLRGGTAVITDNYIGNITGIWGDKGEIFFNVQMVRRNAGPFACWGNSTPGVQWPVPQQVGQSHDGSGYVNDPVSVWNNSGHTPTWYVVEYDPNECGTDADTAADYIAQPRDIEYAAKTGWVKPTGVHLAAFPHTLRTVAVLAPPSIKLQNKSKTSIRRR